MRSYSSLLVGLADAMSSLVSLPSAEVLFFDHDLPFEQREARATLRELDRTKEYVGAVEQATTAATVARAKARMRARTVQAERTKARASRGNLAPLAASL